ncbi:hypothetical protein V5O48_015093 [Marasmius crinis-equi]|uniref:Uncharacterized protein n=1 Tax=Marasmius crinis-equi TaxID=585013 RepID=A0ABR3EVG5_9AGAR
MPSSPLETTATCPHSIRQRPLPPDEWFDFNVSKAPADEKPQSEKPTAYDALYIMFMPLLAMISFIVVAILTLPIWCVRTPLEWLRNAVRTPGQEIGIEGLD